MDGNDNVRLKEKAKHWCARKMRRTDSGPPMKRRNLKRKLKQHGITWHEELKDKAASIKTHVYYAMKTCHGSPDALRKNLDNIVEHYKDSHGNCQPESRCSTDENYIPSKVNLKDSSAISILVKAIHSLQVYKTPQDFVHFIDTHYVESYNNACLIYHDKRISFGKKENTKEELIWQFSIGMKMSIENFRLFPLLRM